MIKSTRSRLSGLDVHLLAILASITGIAAVPFTLGLTAKGEETPADPETETDEEKKKRLEKEKAEQDEKEKKDEEEKAKASASTRPGIASCLAGAFASLKGQGPATLAADLKTEREAHAATKATLAQSSSDLATAQASLKSERDALGTLCGWLGIKAEDVAGKSSAEIHATLATKVNAAAIEQVAGLGFNAKALPAPDATGTGEAKSKGELMREFNAITDPNVRAEFYAKNKAAMGL
jgi:hypothetical protein